MLLVLRRRRRAAKKTVAVLQRSAASSRQSAGCTAVDGGLLLRWFPIMAAAAYLHEDPLLAAVQPPGTPPAAPPHQAAANARLASIKRASAVASAGLAYVPRCLRRHQLRQQQQLATRMFTAAVCGDAAALGTVLLEAEATSLRISDCRDIVRACSFLLFFLPFGVIVICTTSSAYTYIFFLK